MPRLLEWLSREQPDVACLQELKCADESLPAADIEAAGYGAVWHGQKGFNGVAILARGAAPSLRRVGLPGDPDDSHSRYIEAEVDRDVFSVRAMQHDALMQPESRAALRRVVHQGWTDALRALNPTEDRLYTFWDYTAGAWQRD